MREVSNKFNQTVIKYLTINTECIEYGVVVNQTTRISMGLPGEPPVNKIIDKCKHKAMELIVGTVKLSHLRVFNYFRGNYLKEVVRQKQGSFHIKRFSVTTRESLTSGVAEVL